MSVFVLDKRGKPLMPCSEKRARLLLTKKRARVHKMYPFTIRMVDRLRADSALQDVVVKIDPGSKETGLAVVRTDPQKNVHCLLLAHLIHRGASIRKKLQQRAGYRRRRRSCNKRYRAPRFENRTRRDGWIPPSLQHRVDTTLAWVRRFQRIAPVSELAVERVKFDMQLLENPDISGTDYQRGDLYDWNLWEYLLERDGRKCVYCGAEGVSLEKEHIIPKSRGGSNRPSNLTLACRCCNQKKGDRTASEFLKGKPDVLARVMANTKRSLRDGAAVNATRNRLFLDLLQTGVPVEASTGAQTKLNRTRLGIQKDHCLDAACVGDVADVFGTNNPVLLITCNGRGLYSRTKPDASGFPRLRLPRQKVHKGFQTGDMVKAIVPSGKKAGTHAGRVAVRSTGSFNIGKVQGISWKHCRIIARADGYGYATKIANQNEEARKAA